MSRIAILDSAMDDIVELTDYLSDYSESAADTLTDALGDCFEQLGVYPRLGRERPEVTPEARSFALNRVGVAVYDALGRRLTTLLDQDIAAGHHRVRWDSRDAPSGVYLIRVTAGTHTATHRVVLAR